MSAKIIPAKGQMPWHTAEGKAFAEQIAHELNFYAGDRDAGREGYGVWHERAGEACYAAEEALWPSSSTVSWYFKVTHVGSRIQVRVCGKIPGMDGYNIIDWFYPLDTDPYMIQQTIQILRRGMVQCFTSGALHGSAS